MAEACVAAGYEGDFYALGPNALVIAGGDAARAASEAAERARVRVAGQVDFGAAPARLAEQGGLDLIVLDADGVEDMALDAVLARVDMLACERAIPVVAVFAREQIDRVAAQLRAPGTQLLCEAGPGELLVALTIARQQAEAQIADARRPRGGFGARATIGIADASPEAEAARLRRLNEEVARIADTLVRLTRGEEPEPYAVRAPDLAYRGAEDVSEIAPHEIRAAIRTRRLRDQYFANGLFADPAWDMLLDLFAAELEQRRVSVSSLCIAAAVPPTTALRWIATMHDAGLFERHADPHDRRRAYIALSAKGREGMRAYLAAVKRHGLAIA